MLVPSWVTTLVPFPISYGHLSAHTRIHYPHFNYEKTIKISQLKKNYGSIFLKSTHKIVRIIVFNKIKNIQNILQKLYTGMRDQLLY